MGCQGMKPAVEVQDSETNHNTCDGEKRRQRRGELSGVHRTNAVDKYRSATSSDTTNKGRKSAQ